MPRGTDTGDLVNDGAIVIQQVVELAQPLRVATYTDVLSHLETRDLVVSGASRDITVVLAKNASLVRRDLLMCQV